MENRGLSNNSISFGISLTVASIANAFLVAAKEKSPKVLACMQGLTGHHWITHCVAIILLFLFLGVILTRLNRGKGMNISANSLLITVVGGVVISGVMIVGFYLIEG